MAKRKRKQTGKSEAIREFSKNNPDAKPKEIAAKLNEAGVRVTPAYVSTILATAKRGGKAKAKRGRPARKLNRASVSIDNLLAVKKLVETIGSVEEAKNAVAQYSQLMA